MNTSVTGVSGNSILDESKWEVIPPSNNPSFPTPPDESKAPFQALLLKQLNPPLQLTSPQASPSLVQKYAAEVFSSELFSFQDDLQRRATTNKKIVEFMEETQKASAQMDQSIQDFYSSASEVNDVFKQGALEQMRKLLKGKEINSKKMNNMDALSQFAKAVATQYFETSKRLAELYEMSLKGKVSLCDFSIKTLFDTRMSELKLLSERIELMRKQETHEIDKETKLRNQALEEQSRLIGLIFEAIKKEDKKELKELQQQLQENQARYQRENDLKELQLKEQQLKENNTKEKIEGIEKQSNEKKEELQKSVAENQILIQTNSELVKALNESENKCSIS